MLPGLLRVVLSLGVATRTAGAFVLSATATVRAFDGAVAPAVCSRLDAAAAAMGGGHVLFDREQRPGSPIEQIIDRAMRRADDTSRYPVSRCAYRVRGSCREGDSPLAPARSLAPSLPRRYAEYWWRDEWMSLDAHRDADEGHSFKTLRNLQRVFACHKHSQVDSNDCKSDNPKS